MVVRIGLQTDWKKCVQDNKLKLDQIIVNKDMFFPIRWSLKSLIPDYR